MSQAPGDPALPSLSYETPPREGNAPLLVRLAAIFNLTMAGLDAVYGLFQIGMAIFFYFIAPRMAAFAPPAGAPAPPGPPPWVILIYIPLGLLGLSVATFKVIASIKLLRRSRHAWGLGLAAGIVGCCQLWCSLFCVMPLAVGIFTIVILALDHVRQYLLAPPRFPVPPSGSPADLPQLLDPPR